MTFGKIIRFTLKSRSANFTRLNQTPFVYSESRDGITLLTITQAIPHLRRKKRCGRFPTAPL
ncbi:hypothetical protein [Rubritalea tangerina]|uniref:hypothetical protein n=1 Tax=Rubritalea tangerina TaxID=430798 RepID=UPI003606D554